MGIEKEPQVFHIPVVKEKLNILKEVVKDYQEHLYFSKDADAHLGHKASDSSFFGYKTHIVMNDESIITVEIVTKGEKIDGKYLQSLIQKSKSTGMEIFYRYCGTAYSDKNNLQFTKKNKLQLVAKLNLNISQGSRKKENVFEFDKEARIYVSG